MSISAWVSSGYLCDPQVVGGDTIVVRGDLEVVLSEPSPVEVVLSEIGLSVSLGEPAPLQVCVSQTNIVVTLCRCLPD